MGVSIYEGEKTVTGGAGIEVTANKVINLLLRSANNLIKIDGNNEVYTDLQLEDGISTTDTLPVGVTTGRVLEADGWVKSGTMLCFKTTSGDYVTWIYGDDNKLYIDNGTGTFKQIYLKSEVDELFAQLRSEISAVGFSGEYDDLLNKPTLGTAAALDVGTEPYNIPQIGENGTLPSSILPAMAMKAFTVDTYQDLITISDAITGDVAYIKADNQAYILTAEPYSDINNWQEYSAVNSVNGYRGVVNLTTNDIPVQGTTNMYVTSTEKSKWNAKLGANDVATVALTGNYNDLNNKPTLDSTLDINSTRAIQNSAVATAVNTINSNISSIQGDITNLQSAIGGASGDISDIETTITNMQGDITTIQGDVTSINGDITTIQGDITALQQAVSGGISDAAFSSAWNGDTTHAPSKNAIYGVLGGVETLLANL